jgi:hypothetical protein
VRHSFYDSIEYKVKQADLVRSAWKNGVYEHLAAIVRAVNCKWCKNKFYITGSNPKLFCSRSCSAKFNNKKRGGLRPETKKKISNALRGVPNVNKGKILVARVQTICPGCRKTFYTERWRRQIYCSNYCLIRDIGGRPTSPRAARGKSGIRPDISPDLYFFSRWEANFARILNFLGMRWKFQPKVFQLETQKYTPDFYLPDADEYIEIKNFLSDYSKNRDEEFRRCFPNIKLTLILKPEYLKLQEKFLPLIKTWEFSRI